jgi:phytoene dehydrogenase-like protein
MPPQGVVIVGGGLSGLTAAVQLGRLRVPALVCDERTELGGRARTARQGQFHLNYGPHRLYARGAAVAALRQLDIAIDAAPRGPNGGLAVWHGRAYTLPVGFCSLMTTDLLSARAKCELAQLLGSLKAVSVEALQRVSIAQWLRTHASDSDVIQLLSCMVRQTTYCDDPARLSASAAIEQLRLSLSGDVLYVHRGWASLVAALHTAAIESGTTIISGSRVISIETAGGRASHVTLANGVRVPADAVIIAASPRAAREMLGPAIDDTLSTTEIRVATLDLALRTLPRTRTVFAYGIDEPWSFSADSAIARVAPIDGAVVHVVKYLCAGATGESADEGQLERALDLLQPGWRRLVIYRRFLPTMPVAHAMVAADQGGFLGRPSGRVPGLENVFLAGDWVGPVGQLADASIASAVQAARAAAQMMSRDVTGHASH